MRVLFRLPAYLYRWHGGWLLGYRFLLLVHTGRRTGRRRETVLEVMKYRSQAREAVVMSGFGHGANWLRNIEIAPRPEIVIARDRFVAQFRRLTPDEACLVVESYEHRHRWLAPILRWVLSRLLGWRYRGSEEERRRLAAQLPLIAFRPAL